MKLACVVSVWILVSAPLGACFAQELSAAAVQQYVTMVLSDDTLGARCDNARLADAVDKRTQSTSSLDDAASDPAVFDHRIQFNQALSKAPGEHTAELWLRVVNPANQRNYLDTRGTQADAELAVFTDCSTAQPASATTQAAPLANATLALPRLGHTQAYFVRLRLFSAESAGRSAAQRVRVSLLAGSVVSGQVLRNSTSVPLPVLVRAFDEQRRLVSSVATSASGAYELAIPDVVARIYVRTSKYLGGQTFLDGVYPSGICRNVASLDNCELASALTVATPPGGATTIAAMRLLEGAILEGAISVPSGAVNAARVAGLSAIGAESFNATGAVDAVGRYRIEGLYPEALRVYASAANAAPAVHANLACAGPRYTDCPLSMATPVQLLAGQTTRVDFNLTAIGGLRLLLDPIVAGTVDVFRADGSFLSSMQTFGQPEVFLPLAPGSYKVRLNYQSHFSQIAPATDCLFPCLAELANATPLTVVGATILSVPITPRLFPILRITALDRSTQLPIVEGLLQATPASGAVNTEQVMENGVAQALLTPGRYVVRALSRAYIDQSLPGVACQPPQNANPSIAQCPGAQELTISLNSPALIERTFQLDRSGSISGRGRNEIALFNSAGSNFYAVDVIAPNVYRVPDVIPGTYHVGAAYFNAFPQLFNGVNCPFSEPQTPFANCNFAAATLVPVLGGMEVGNIDFSPRLSSAIRGRVVDRESGAPIFNAVLDIWAQTSGPPALWDSVRTDSEGYFEVYASGPRWVSTDLTPGYIAQIYPGVLCQGGSAASGACSPTLGQLVAADTTLTGTGIVIALRAIGTFQNGFED
jgi:hypothetical protein